MNNRALFVSMAAAGWLFFGVRFSLAATFNIPNGNVAALIAAINTANNNDDFDTINLASNGLYTLTAVNNSTNGNNGLPLVQNDVSFGGTEIGTDLTINGNGARLERSEFAPEFRLLQVVGGATCVINNLNMNRGRAIALTGSQGGGAIFNNASRVILGGCSFDNNATRGMDGADVSETRHGIEGRGGALCSSSAIVMQASACTFSNNKAQGGNGGRPNFGEGGRGGQAQGGAIYSSNDVLLLSNCTFIGNFGSGGVGPAGEGTMGGGGIFAAGGLLSGCTFASNSAYSGGALLITGNVTLDGCTLSSNFATSRGGAVYNYGTALVNNCSITNGLAVFGGGIFNNGVLTITNSRFSGNFTNVNSAVSFDTGGGAIYYSPLFADEDSLTIRNTIFENNEARKGNDRLADGGAIYNFMQLAHSGKVIVDRCTFRGNRAELGSGIYQKIETGPSDLIVTDSTFVGNRADGSGAGICQFVSYKFGAATLTAINSTFSDNFAGQAGSGIYNGAVNDAASGAANATIVSCTFSGNSASSGGGAALANYNSAAAMKLSNTILKTGAIGTNLANGGGTFTSQGNNLSNDAAGGDGATGPGGFLDAPEDIRNTDPKLDTLQKNGGSTETQALLPGSPAIDAGNDSKAPPQDQRGFPRFGRSDIGAFEVQSTSTPTPTPNPTITPTATPSPTPTPIATPTPTATATPAPTATPTPTATPVPTPEPSPTPQPPAPVITSPLSVTAVVGQPFTYQIIASNSPTSYGASNLPNGLALDGGLGIISGRPTTVGQNQAGLTAANASGAGFASLTLKVEAAPAVSGPMITNALSVTARTDQPFSFQVFASGMTSNMRVVANALPPGIIFDSSTNRFSGTPAANGSYAVQLLITSRPPLDDQIFYSTTLQITFVSDTAVPVITSPSSITLTPGQPFNYTIASPNSASDPTIFSLIGTLPEGLSFDPATGQISGTYQGSARRRSQPAGSPPNPAVASEDSGSAVMTVMLVARNSRGIATAPLTFLLPQPVRFANISTRLRVETGDNALIGGFIVTGTQPKKIIVRGIGTSLPFLDRLENPTLELHGPFGLIEANDNWVESPNRQAIIDSTIPPGSGFESAIVATVPANNSAYTAIVRGAGGETGIGVVEAYDLDGTVDSKLANISTRGLVQTADNVLIAGTIVVGPAAQRVIVRAIGPSLPVLDKLEDPVLELRDGNGELVAANDNWRIGGQEAEIIATTIPPGNDLESAIVATLPAGGASYTAIVRGVGDTTGIAVVEVYALQ